MAEYKVGLVTFLAEQPNGDLVEDKVRIYPADRAWHERRCGKKDGAPNFDVMCIAHHALRRSGRVPNDQTLDEWMPTIVALEFDNVEVWGLPTRHRPPASDGAGDRDRHPLEPLDRGGSGRHRHRARGAGRTSEAEGRTMNDPIVRVEGLNDYLRALSRMGTEATAEMRAAANEIAADQAMRLQYAARARSKQSRGIAAGITVRRDRVPKVAVGKQAKARFSRRPTPGNPLPTMNQIWPGTEYGQNRPRQFPARRKEGYWLWPTLRRWQPEFRRRWVEAYNRIADAYTRG